MTTEGVDKGNNGSAIWKMRKQGLSNIKKQGVIKLEEGDCILGCAPQAGTPGTPNMCSRLPKPTDSLVCSQLVKVSEQFCTSKGKL